MAETRIGGQTFEALQGTVELIAEAVARLHRLDEHRSQQLIALETELAGLRDEMVELRRSTIREHRPRRIH